MDNYNVTISAFKQATGVVHSTFDAVAVGAFIQLIKCNSSEAGAPIHFTGLAESSITFQPRWTTE